MLEAILLTVITSATPLLFAAMGEAVTERSGTLNLGVEGMMAVGAVSGFAAALATDSGIIGVLAAAGAGMGLAFLFGVLTISLAANQVATGLALTLLGLGLSGLIGEGYVGVTRPALPKLDAPSLLRQDALVYLSLALAPLVWLFLRRSRAGLTLRAVGDNPASAHSLGYSVLRTRYAAILFGGACAGLGGGYLSLAYTPLWVEGMTGGRGWIALALVVFASWSPWRVLLGAYVFGTASILQFHAQALGVGIPAQALSALPYLATILVLVLIARRRGAAGDAPAALGRPFVPDR